MQGGGLARGGFGGSERFVAGESAYREVLGQTVGESGGGSCAQEMETSRGVL